LRLAGRVAIITGAARGIGRAIAEEFAREGAKVVIADVLEGEARKAAEEIKALGAEAIACRVNVSNVDDVEEMVRITLSNFGRVDVLVNNAGIAIQKEALEMSKEDWQRVVDVNLTGVFLCSQAVGRVMAKQGGGVIINISSVLGIVAIPLRAAYCATKAGVIGLTKALAVEWSKYGIRVVAIAPGYVATERVIDLLRRGVVNEEALKMRTPMGRLARPEEIAKLAAYLASDDAKYITGETVVIDGGFTAFGGPI